MSANEKANFLAATFIWILNSLLSKSKPILLNELNVR